VPGYHPPQGGVNKPVESLGGSQGVSASWFNLLYWLRQLRPVCLLLSACGGGRSVWYKWREP
jgi:hypothetical protein